MDETLDPAPPPSAMPPVPARPRVWTVWVAFVGALLVGFLGCVVLLLSIMLARYFDVLRHPADTEQIRAVTKEAMESPLGLFGCGASMAIGLLLPSLVGSALSKSGFRARLRMKPSRLRPADVALASAAFISWSFFAGTLIPLVWKHANALQLLSRVISQMRPGLVPVALVSIAFVAGFSEEIFFRGYMQTRLEERWGRWPAVLVTSVCFGLTHLDVAQGTYAALGGILLGWVASRGQSIWPGVVIHVLNNATSVICIRLFGVEGGPSDNAAALAFTGTLCAVSLWMLRLRNTSEAPLENPTLTAP